MFLRHLLDRRDHDLQWQRQKRRPANHPTNTQRIRHAQRVKHSKVLLPLTGSNSTSRPPACFTACDLLTSCVFLLSRRQNPAGLTFRVLLTSNCSARLSDPLPKGPREAAPRRRRSSCACAVTKGFLFVTGGYATRFGTLRSVLRLDRGVTGRWRPEEGLLEGREGHACVGSDVDEGIVYAIGGANGTAGPLSSTERARLYFDGHGEVRRAVTPGGAWTRRGRAAA